MSLRTRARFPIPLRVAPLTLGLSVQAATTNEVESKSPADALMEEVYIFGDGNAPRTLPGSAALISAEQMRIEFANDINQVLKTVPGTYIREEDGYGLRPNIGIRGATSERSSKITLWRTAS